MNYTKAQWIDLAKRHQEYVDGLQDGTLCQSDVAVAGMSVDEALVVERRNVTYCMGQAEITVEVAA